MLLLCTTASIELLVYREYRRLVCRLDGNGLFLFQNRRIPFYLKNQPTIQPTDPAQRPTTQLKTQSKIRSEAD